MGCIQYNSSLKHVRRVQNFNKKTAFQLLVDTATFGMELF